VTGLHQLSECFHRFLCLWERFGVALWARPEYLGNDGVVMVRFPVGIISEGMEDPLGLI
jgi:hypothetical protein